jgi:hypothetical protein
MRRLTPGSSMPGVLCFIGKVMEVTKHFVAMTPKQLKVAAEAMAVIIVAHIKANRKRAAEALRQSEGIPQSQTEGTPDESSDSL